MDSMGAILEGDWSCLSEMYTPGQEADFMSQLLSNFPLPEDETRIPSFFWPANHANADSNSSSDSFSPVSNILFSSSSHESYYLTNSHPVFTSPMSMDFCMEDGTNTTSFLVEAGDCFNTKNVEKDDRGIQQPAVLNKKLESKRETEMPKPEPIITENNSKKRTPSSAEMPKPEPIITENNSKKTTPSSAEMPKPEPIFIEKNSKKRTPSSGDVQKTKRNARSKKNQSSVSNSIANNDEEGNGGLNGQSWASCSSEDDSSASQELKQEAALNMNGKTRASRGAATDPQSLYARKRRERINERLRILQNLVPNGTKVDISTMLEEAVQYVKFLQLQIKLLSSDDHWMYAPIAYNGIDIGLDLLPNIS